MIFFRRHCLPLLLPLLALAAPCCAPGPRQARPAGEKPAAAAGSRQMPPGPAPTAPPQPAEPPIQELLPKEIGRVTFAATGDVLMHGFVKRSAAEHNQKDAAGRSLNNEGLDFLFDRVREAFAGRDIGLANLETPVTADGWKGTKEYFFNAPPVLLDALKKLGVGVVTFANNHAHDQGAAGLAETLRNVEAKGLKLLGAGANREAARQGVIIERGGLKTGLIGATMLMNLQLDQSATGTPQVFYTKDTNELVAAVRELRPRVDFLVFSLHWGREYLAAPEAAIIELAHQLAEAGVDVLLGHHPHVLQPIEAYRTASGRVSVICYSLGNFISNQSRFYQHGVHALKGGDTRDGVVVQFAAVKFQAPGGSQFVRLADFSAVPLWTENSAPDQKGKAPLVIQTVMIDREAAAAEKRLRELLKNPADSPEIRREVAELSVRLQLYQDRRQRIASILGGDYLP